MSNTYYLFFKIHTLPDLTLSKYSAFDASSVDSIMEKHSVFLRQLHRMGTTEKIHFHLLYQYDPDKRIPKGKHLSILFYATSQDPKKLERIREFLTTSVLSNYYDFYCYEVATDFRVITAPSTGEQILEMENISGITKRYYLDSNTAAQAQAVLENTVEGEEMCLACEFAPNSNKVVRFSRTKMDQFGRIMHPKNYAYGAYLTKKEYALPAFNHLNTDPFGDVLLYSILEWVPCRKGRLYNVLKLMEGYDQSTILRIDLFPVAHEVGDIRRELRYKEVRLRTSLPQRDDNSEAILRSLDNYLNNLMKHPLFTANVVAFADYQDVAVMLVDSVAAEAVESGTYEIEAIPKPVAFNGFDMYYMDTEDIRQPSTQIDETRYAYQYLTLYTLEEIRPMFSFPILYPGETVECLKETDPSPYEDTDGASCEQSERIMLGVSEIGYKVTFPVNQLRKHAFVAGVPGAGKTNTMLYMISSLWKNAKQKTPFLVLEPAKQEYRALAMQQGMEDLCIFSPGADTKFPLHINPFEFPIGMTLSEHIANLNAVFAGAFELPPPSPHFIDTCIQKVYMANGWNINERNEGKRKYPTLQELYESLEQAVEDSHYEGETRGNLQAVLEVRVGSLLKREIGNVYNVHRSIIQPEEWLTRPIVVELEALGEGPANFMALLISTLIREVLKVRKTRDPIDGSAAGKPRQELQHVIFYEEAHNLIGPNTDNPNGYTVDPKVAATKFLVRMLAEVRALGEGIVIADQLPTAVASEVLKNTGLKLAHRLTALDDRKLLGGTMSATAEQLEDQGTFGTGQALIFYEGLLKPFKIRVCEWEERAPASKYESPPDSQLFNHLRNSHNYIALLEHSADIVRQKIRTEFRSLSKYAKKLDKELETLRREIEEVERDISTLDKQLSNPDQELRKGIETQVKSLKRQLQQKSELLDSKGAYTLRQLCRESCNLYYAYMTMSRNYDQFKDDMYICTIQQFLGMFGAMYSLCENRKLAEIIRDETEAVMQEIQQYINYCNDSMVPVLGNHDEWGSAIFACRYYLCSMINLERQELETRARNLMNSTNRTQADLEIFCQDLSDIYGYYDQLVRYQQEASATFYDKLMDSEYEDWGQSVWIQDYLVDWNRCLKCLAMLAINPLLHLKSLVGDNRFTLLQRTYAIRVSLEKLVNYHDAAAETALSDWSRYKDVRTRATALAEMEMLDQFGYAQESLRNSQNMDEEHLKQPENVEQLKNVAKQYGGLLQRYIEKNVGTAHYKELLMQQYTQFLDVFSQLGSAGHQQIRMYAKGCWSQCLPIIGTLIDTDQVGPKQKEAWITLSETLADIFNGV
jgi:hypothetical protein